MVFCGQCGLQLAPGDTICPRCGSIVEDELPKENPHLYDPTVASMAQPHATPQALPPAVQPPRDSYTPPQQKLVLRPDRNNPGFGAPAANDPTSMMAAQGPTVPPPQQASTPYPGYSPQSGSSYPHQPVSYPGYPSTERGSYSQVPGQFGTMQPLPPPVRRGRGRTLALLVILLILLVALGTVAVFVARPGLLKGLLSNKTISTPTTVATPTPADQARSLIQQYYADINKQDYQGAYNLWGADYQSKNPYSNFAAGYAHTKHDDVTINSLTTNADGTVTANITIVAQEETASGTTRQSTYQGTYNIGQENGVWKFLRGTFQ